MGKKEDTGRVTVKFLQEYAAKRGQGIIGAKGAVKQYPMTKQLRELMDEDRDGGAVLELVKEAPAEKRTKAAGKPAGAE